MKRRLAAALALFVVAGHGPAWAQAPAQAPANICSDLPKLSDEAQKRGNAVSTAMKAKADRKQVCVLMSSFVVAEAAVVKFLADNQTWCGIPAEAIANSKANHEKSLKFRTIACTDSGPQQKPPSLSDAIKSTPTDSSSNTKTGHGTFDTLTGNPLAK